MSDPQIQTDGRVERAKSRREKRRREILECARTVIGARGYTATTIDDVIEEAGISRGTFYNYFDGREPLFLELLDDYLAALRAEVETISMEHPEPLAALYGNIERMVRRMIDSPDLTTILFREAVGAGEDIDQRVHAFYAFLRGHVVGALKKGAARGVTREVDVELVSSAIIGAVKEVLTQHVVVARDRTLDVDRIVQAIFDFGYLGLRTS
ncbi:MAG: AcrR family transcriptional regulator [Flavobacteriales bacterium]|jgi:AcrR family transcriptional regulator